MHPALVPLLLLGAALPAPCMGACVVQGEALVGFVPPVLVMTSGSRVAWEGLDNAPHVNIEGALEPPEASCFVVAYGGGSRSPEVGLRLQGGGLVAELDGRTLPCTSATMLPGGSALLGYQCVIHALTMKGHVLVVP